MWCIEQVARPLEPPAVESIFQFPVGLRAGFSESTCPKEKVSCVGAPLWRFSCRVPADTVGGQRAELDKIIQRKVLANGLEVIVVENHGVPLATIEIDVKNGSFTQSPEYAGLAHMYEHMFFRRELDISRAESFWDRARDLGAVFNGTTAEERVNYYMTVPADKLGGGIHLLAAALRARCSGRTSWNASVRS